MTYPSPGCLKHQGRPRFQPTTDHRQRVTAMVDAGVSIKAIAAAIGVTDPTLRRHFAAELPEPTPSPRRFVPTAEQRAAVIELASADIKAYAIAKALGIAESTAWQHFGRELEIGQRQHRARVAELLRRARLARARSEK